MQYSLVGEENLALTFEDGTKCVRLGAVRGITAASSLLLACHSLCPMAHCVAVWRSCKPSCTVHPTPFTRAHNLPAPQRWRGV